VSRVGGKLKVPDCYQRIIPISNGDGGMFHTSARGLHIIYMYLYYTDKLIPGECGVTLRLLINADCLPPCKRNVNTSPTREGESQQFALGKIESACPWPCFALIQKKKIKPQPQRTKPKQSTADGRYIYHWSNLFRSWVVLR